MAKSIPLSSISPIFPCNNKLHFLEASQSKVCMEHWASLEVAAEFEKLAETWPNYTL